LEQQFLRLIQEADDALVGDTVMDEPPVTLPRHQTALGQAVQVHRGVRLTQPGAVDDLARAQGSVSQRLEDAQARGIAETTQQFRPEEEAAVSHISF
jgi:hypothetical protein